MNIDRRQQRKIMRRAARTMVWRDGELIIRVFVVIRHVHIGHGHQATMVPGVRLRLRDAKRIAERALPGHLWTFHQMAEAWSYPTRLSGERVHGTGQEWYRIQRYDVARISWAGLLVGVVLILAGLATIIQYS